uniref:Sel1 repeat family protein n=1 Tax=Azospirillum brasilense TaxID=192 RepID=Q6QWA6_AZOBR|nr:hypothetical protein pRhico045 [Azospirillum brasilense]
MYGHWSDHKDFVQARAWLERAAALGDGRAKTLLERIPVPPPSNASDLNGGRSRAAGEG